MSTMSRSPLLLRGKTGKFLLTNGRQWVFCLFKNRFFSIFAALTLSSAAASAQQTNQFDPTLPLNVTDLGGFVGSFNPPENYTRAIVSFNFTGLNPDPLTSPFFISNISLKGDGITSSLSFANLQITGNDFFSTAAVNLNTPVSNLDFVNSLVSFDIGANVINPDALFAVSIQYRNSNGTQVNTSNIALSPTYQAVPEPSTYALLVVSALGLAVHVIRRRRRA